MASAFAAPEHAGVFKPLADDGLASGLDHARTDEIPGLAEGELEHAGAVKDDGERIINISDL